MEHPGLVDRAKLSTWARTNASRYEFPKLIRRLIHETTTGPLELVMPTEEGISAGGYDGYVKAIETSFPVPVGLSVWELSVGKDYGKADRDYGKRNKTPDGSALEECVYVQAILGPWTKRAEWSRERTAENKWKKVMALGIDEIVDWMESAPVTWAWISERVGLSPYGFRSAEAWWNAWSSQTNPVVTAELVTKGRGDAEKSLLDRLGSVPKTTTITGASVDEVRAFIVAAVTRADDSGRTFAKTVFVNDLGTWRSLLATKRSLVLIPTVDGLADEIPSESIHHVVVPVANSDVADIILTSIDAAGAVEVLKACGLDEKRANEYGRLARRSLIALRRRMAINRALHVPAWAKPPASRTVRAALIASSWADQNGPDRKILEALSGLSYEEFVEELSRSSLSDDPLVSLVGGSWHLVSPVDAWMLLRGQITEDDLQRMKNAVDLVLGERDPALDLPPDERWKAGIQKKVLTHSSDLRRGLARTLALLAMNGLQVNISGSANGAEWARYAVREILDAANADASASTWASLSGLLPLLAEAAPDAFLAAVTTGLDGANPLLATLFGDPNADSDFYSANSHHTGLLWALENLAWSPVHFGAAVDALARLDAVDPGGRLSNRPAASLAAIFCPWRPENSANYEQRLSIIDVVRERYSKGSWKLMQLMLPEFQGIHFPTHEPSYRDWKPPRVPVTEVEYFRFISEITTRVLEDVGTSVERWTQVLDRISNLFPNDRSRVIAALHSLIAAEEISRVDTSQLWQNLQKTIGKHREYTDARWALPPDDVYALQKLADLLKPSSSLETSLRLFTEHSPHLAELSERTNYDAYNLALRIARGKAMKEVDDEGGLELVRRLASQTTVQGAAGVALADAVGERYEAKLLPALDQQEGPEVDLAWSYFARRYEIDGWAVIERHLTVDSTLESLGMARLLLTTHDFPKAWEQADSLGSNVARLFWLNFRPFGFGNDSVSVEYIASQMLQVGRIAAALDFLSMPIRRVGAVTIEIAQLIVRGLQALLQNPEDTELRSLSEYDFEALFAPLEQHVQVLGVDIVGSLEWAFLPALGYEPNVPTLHRRMAEHPEFFVEVLSTVYRRQHSVDDELTDEEQQRRKALATNGYRLLSSWSLPPGFDGERIDADLLNVWLKDVQQLLHDADQYEIGMQHLGQVLVVAPSDTDGSWPPEAVRDIFEILHSDDVESGFRMGITNRRGVTSRGLEDGGVQERALVVKYLADADAATDRWPVTARILRAVASSYEAQARHNDQSAERFRQGL